jgi:hypothetical protein
MTGPMRDADLFGPLDIIITTPVFFPPSKLSFTPRDYSVRLTFFSCPIVVLYGIHIIDSSIDI